MSDRFTESVVEDAALGWLESMGYEVPHGQDVGSENAGGNAGETPVKTPGKNARDVMHLLRDRPHLSTHDAE